MAILVLGWLVFFLLVSLLSALGSHVLGLNGLRPALVRPSFKELVGVDPELTVNQTWHLLNSAGLELLSGVAGRFVHS